MTPFTDAQARERYAQERFRAGLDGMPHDDATVAAVGRALLTLEARIATLEQERDAANAELQRRKDILNRVRDQRPHTLDGHALIQWWEAQVEEAVEYLHAASAKREEALEARVRELEQERDDLVGVVNKNEEQRLRDERDAARREVEALRGFALQAEVVLRMNMDEIEKRWGSRLVSLRGLYEHCQHALRPAAALARIKELEQERDTLRGALHEVLSAYWDVDSKALNAARALLKEKT